MFFCALGEKEEHLCQRQAGHDRGGMSMSPPPPPPATPLASAAATGVSQLVRAPVLITLPTAYVLTLFIYNGLGLGEIFAPLLAALIVFLADLLVDVLKGETPDSPWDYLVRLVYVIVNTAILWGLLTGTISLPTEET
jgi:hypothetical protein